MENGRAEKSIGKHVVFETELQNWTIFACSDKRSGALRNFASKSNVFFYAFANFHFSGWNRGKKRSKTCFGKTAAARVEGEIQKKCANASNSIRAFWLAWTPGGKFGAKWPLAGNSTKGRHGNHLCAHRKPPGAMKFWFSLFVPPLALVFSILGPIT